MSIKVWQFIRTILTNGPATDTHVLCFDLFDNYVNKRKTLSHRTHFYVEDYMETEVFIWLTCQQMQSLLTPIKTFALKYVHKIKRFVSMLFTYPIIELFFDYRALCFWMWRFVMVSDSTLNSRFVNSKTHVKGNPNMEFHYFRVVKPRRGWKGEGRRMVGIEKWEQKAQNRARTQNDVIHWELFATNS